MPMHDPELPLITLAEASGRWNGRVSAKCLWRCASCGGRPVNDFPLVSLGQGDSRRDVRPSDLAEWGLSQSGRPFEDFQVAP